MAKTPVHPLGDLPGELEAVFKNDWGVLTPFNPADDAKF